MTFMGKIEQLRLKAAAFDDEDKIKSHTGEFTTLRDRLEAAAANAANVAAGRKELQAAGVTQESYDQDRASALSVAKNLISMVEDLSVEKKFDALKMQVSPIETHFRNSEKFVARAWQEFQPPAPPSADDLLDSLEQAGVDVENIRSDLEDAKSVLLRLGSRRLPEPGDIATLRQALSRLSSSASRIGEVIDPAIAQVVMRAQDGGVPYSEMTPQVVQALKELGLLDRFRVVLK